MPTEQVLQVLQVLRPQHLGTVRQQKNPIPPFEVALAKSGHQRIGSQ
jgi:hypothetical protein